MASEDRRTTVEEARDAIGQHAMVCMDAVDAEMIERVEVFIEAVRQIEEKLEEAGMARRGRLVHLVGMVIAVVNPND